MRGAFETRRRRPSWPARRARYRRACRAGSSPDDPLAERGEAVCLGIVVGGVGPVESRVVRQGHVTRPRRWKARSWARSSSIATPPSIPISEAILPVLDDALDVVGRVRHLEVVGIALDHPVDQVDLLGDGPRGVGMLARDIDRPELRLEAPLAEPGDIGLARSSRWRRSNSSRPKSPSVRSRQGRSLCPSKSIPAAWTFPPARRPAGGSPASRRWPTLRPAARPSTASHTQDQNRPA